MKVHTKATWPSRDDRRITLVWLAAFLVITVVGFVSDLGPYFSEQPRQPLIVHVHAVLTTIWLLILTAQVLLVELDKPALHRKLGWFAAGWAALLTVVATLGELQHQALFVDQQEVFGHVPGRSSGFISISLGGVFCFALLTLWAILLRKNPAAHRRVMLVANIAIVTPGFARMARNVFAWQPTTQLGFFFMFHAATVLLLAGMLLWDVKKGRVMQQFAISAFIVLVYDVVSVQLFTSPGWNQLAQGWIRNWASLTH